MSSQTARARLRLPEPLAYVFTGGLARSAAQIGMITPLNDAELYPNMVVGSSTGAVNAALFARDPDDFTASATRLWAGVARDKALTSIRRSTVRGLASSQAPRTQNMLRKHLEPAFGSTSFEQLFLPLRVTATQLVSGQPAIIDSGPVVDALLASMAFPGVMPPCELPDGQLVVDGSVVADVPIMQALAAGAKSAVVLDTGSSAVDESAVSDISWYHVMALAATHMLRSRAPHHVASAAAEIPVIVVSSSSGNAFDLRNALETVRSGEAAASRVLGEIDQQLGRSRRLLGPGHYGDELLSR